MNIWNIHGSLLMRFWKWTHFLLILEISSEGSSWRTKDLQNRIFNSKEAWLIFLI